MVVWRRIWRWLVSKNLVVYPNVSINISKEVWVWVEHKLTCLRFFFLRDVFCLGYEFDFRLLLLELNFWLLLLILHLWLLLLILYFRLLRLLILNMRLLLLVLDLRLFIDKYLLLSYIL